MALLTHKSAFPIKNKNFLLSNQTQHDISITIRGLHKKKLRFLHFSAQ